MADDNNIKHFTAADIEKYHKGLLSSKERNAMEKAALDDPFLADALEGYQMAGAQVVADIDELKSRLNERTAGNKVVAIQTSRRNAFTWWKVAAMIILIGGAGFLTYRLAFVNNKKQDIAKLEYENKAQSPVTKDTLESNLSGLLSEQSFSATTKEKILTTEGTGIQKTEIVKVSAGDGNANLVPEAKTDNLSIKELKKESEITSISSPSKPAVDKLEMKSSGVSSEQDADKDGVSNESEKQKLEIAYQNKPVTTAGKNNELLRNNYFRGRVTDSVNNPLPFANITNVHNNAGTYADVNGYFTLSAPDSVIDVRVSSVGFENNNIQLRNRTDMNQVVLEEGRNGLSEVVIVNNSSTSDRSKGTPIVSEKLKKPEPADGWNNYNTYLINNLRIPGEKRIKNTDDFVEISFDVNKNGRPVNIKVEKSLCKPCDEEAVRLVKEGPKWEKGGKSIRPRVAVPFND